MHENTVFQQTIIFPPLFVPVFQSAGGAQPVSDSRSLTPPCRHTASEPRSPHHRNTTN